MKVRAEGSNDDYDDHHNGDHGDDHNNFFLQVSILLFKRGIDTETCLELIFDFELLPRVKVVLRRMRRLAGP